MRYASSPLNNWFTKLPIAIHARRPGTEYFPSNADDDVWPGVQSDHKTTHLEIGPLRRALEPSVLLAQLSKRTLKGARTSTITRRGGSEWVCRREKRNRARQWEHEKESDPVPLEHDEGASVAAGNRHRWSVLQLAGGVVRDAAFPPRSNNARTTSPCFSAAARRLDDGDVTM